MKHFAIRWNSLSSWAIAQICAEHGIQVDWSGDRVYADLPAIFNGIKRYVSVELTNCTKAELLAEIA